MGQWRRTLTCRRLRAAVWSLVWACMASARPPCLYLQTHKSRTVSIANYQIQQLSLNLLFFFYFAIDCSGATPILRSRKMTLATPPSVSVSLPRSTADFRIAARITQMWIWLPPRNRLDYASCLDSVLRQRMTNREVAERTGGC